MLEDRIVPVMRGFGQRRHIDCWVDVTVDVQDVVWIGEWIWIVVVVGAVWVAQPQDLRFHRLD